MKKKLWLPILFIMAAAAIAVSVSAWHGGRETPVAAESDAPTAPSRMLRAGPVVDGMTSSKTVGNVTVKMEASRMWFKKTKTFGFDNALFKKLAAKDFRLTIIKNGETRISVGKERIEMPPDQSVIEIERPKVLFPAHMQQPDSVTLDNKKMTLSIRTGEEEAVWDLEKPMADWDS